MVRWPDYRTDPLAADCDNLSMDFSRAGPTRGMLDPPRDEAGHVIQPRQAPAVFDVRSLRDSLGLSTEQLADELCVSERTVWRWLGGAPVPDSMRRAMELLAEVRGGAESRRDPAPANRPLRRRRTRVGRVQGVTDGAVR